MLEILGKKKPQTQNQPKHPKQKKARRRDRGTENQNIQELMPFFLKMFNHGWKAIY